MIQPKKIALTVDDLPFHGDTTIEYDRLKIVNNFTSAFKKFNLPPIVGFANMHAVLNATENYPHSKKSEGNAVLFEWVEKGNILANHTFSHIDLENVIEEDFIQDIEKNEDILSRFPNVERYFRYPFLSESRSFMKRSLVHHYLVSHHYRIAPVTIDFYDFMWNTALSKCLTHGNAEGVNHLKDQYLFSAINCIKQASEIAEKLFHRDIHHIILLHLGLATSIFIEPLIQALLSTGHQFITLEEALDDPVYMNDFYMPERNGLNFLQQAAVAHEFDISSYPDVPRKNVLRYAYNLPSTIIL